MISTFFQPLFWNLNQLARTYIKQLIRICRWYVFFFFSFHYPDVMKFWFLFVSIMLYLHENILECDWKLVFFYLYVRYFITLVLVCFNRSLTKLYEFHPQCYIYKSCFFYVIIYQKYLRIWNAIIFLHMSMNCDVHKLYRTIYTNLLVVRYLKEKPGQTISNEFSLIYFSPVGMSKIEQVVLLHDTRLQGGLLSLKINLFV